VRPSKAHADRPILITEVRVSADDEFDHRRKRYLLMMALRAICVVAAATTVRFSGWLAAGFMVGALVLPWTAVLIANDRPPKRAQQFRRFLPGVAAGRELTAGPTENAVKREDLPPRPAAETPPDAPTETPKARAGSEGTSARRTVIDL
jgi:Flp pilus assembly protein TadB